MLSISKCKEILSGSGEKYSDEDIKKVRDFLYLLARFEYQHYKQKKLLDAKSNHLHKGLNR